VTTRSTHLKGKLTMEEHEQINAILKKLAEKYHNDRDTFKKLNEIATLVTILVLKGATPRST